MLTGERTLRRATLLATFAVGFHELRYLLAPVADPGSLSGRHAYLTWVMPAAGGILAALLGAGMCRLAGRSGSHEESTRSPRRLIAEALGCAASLLAVFAVQESVESLLTDGTLRGLATGFGGGGIVVVPLAIALGVVTSLLSMPLPAARPVRAPGRISLRARAAIVSMASRVAAPALTAWSAGPPRAPPAAL